MFQPLVRPRSNSNGCPLLALGEHRAWKRLKAAADGYDRLHGCAPRCAHAAMNRQSAMMAPSSAQKKMSMSALTPRGGAPGKALRSAGQRKNHGAESTNYRDLDPPDADKDKAAEDQGKTSSRSLRHRLQCQRRRPLLSGGPRTGAQVHQAVAWPPIGPWGEAKDALPSRDMNSATPSPTRLGPVRSPQA